MLINFNFSLIIVSTRFITDILHISHIYMEELHIYKIPPKL